MPSEKSVGGHVMHEVPERGAINKFVVTEKEAWFLPVEDDKGEPALAEMIRAVFGEKLDDEGFVTLADEMLNDGRILLGYTRESGEVEIHSPLFVPYPSALRRLKEVYGDVKVVGMGWTASTGDKRRRGGE
ncbi:MAG: hypothetical protein ACRDSJ_13545 [Rubrobacteraceae bacterium]